jgi:hypothetical protein
VCVFLLRSVYDEELEQNQEAQVFDRFHLDQDTLSSGFEIP